MQGGFKGKTAMGLSFFDQSASIFASTTFLNVTAVFMVMAAFAIVRLVALSEAGSVEQLQVA